MSADDAPEAAVEPTESRRRDDRPSDPIHRAEADEIAGLLRRARACTGPDGAKIIPTESSHSSVTDQRIDHHDEQLIKDATERAHQAARQVLAHAPAASVPGRLRTLIARRERSAEAARRDLLDDTVRAAVLRTYLTKAQADDQSPGAPSAPNRDDQS